MANFNRVVLAGHLTRDVEVRHTQSGTAVGKFGLAINRRGKTQDGEVREEVCFVDVTAFGKTAETIAKHVGKGAPLLVEGRLSYSTWESDGVRRSKLDVVAETFQFLGGGDSRERVSGSGSRRGREESHRDERATSGEVPF